MSDSLWHHGWQHARLPCPSLSPRVCSGSCPLSWWCSLTISSSAASFSTSFQSRPASGSFPVSQLFTSGGQRIQASASASVLLMNIQGWLPLGLTGLISLQSKGLSRVFSSTTVQKNQFYNAQPSLWSNSYIHTGNLYIFFMLMPQNCKLNVILTFLWIFNPVKSPMIWTIYQYPNLPEIKIKVTEA